MSPSDLQSALTPREHAVLALIMRGSTSKAAAGVLGISSRTIEFHRANIMQKLSARNVADLMRIVLEDRSAASGDDEVKPASQPQSHRGSDDELTRVKPDEQ